MNAKYFLDTNIFVYLLDQRNPKRTISEKIILSAFQSENCVISIQVIQEFLNVATGKFGTPLTLKDAVAFMQTILFPLCQIYPDDFLYKSALEIKHETNYSFYDSLILAGAAKANCNVLYSEDMQTGGIVRGIHIVNPYIPGVFLIQ